MPDWNNVYTEKSVNSATPSEVVKEKAYLIPAKSKVLEYASGLAGNGIYLAKKGHDVMAWDLSEVAVEKINTYAIENKLNLAAQVHDLESVLPDMKNKFDAVVVSYFLHRDTLRYLYEILKEGGLLFYQTFSGERYENQGPLREAFRLKQNELLEVFSDMQLLFYREDDCRSSADGARQGQVYFVAKK